jgi:hypothetical protein
MGNQQSITDLTRLVQDVQYTAALKGMSKSDRSNYFNTQKDQLITNVTSDREGTFQKTLIDARRNSAIQNSLLFYQFRNRDLNDMGAVFDKQNQQAIGTARFNNQLATRQYEINEWSYGNKMDTLFVFQILFITLLLSASITYLHKLGFFGAPLLGTLIGALLFIDILIIANRTRYTAALRDQRYWNRRQFPHYDIGMGKGPSICPPSTDTTKTSTDSTPATV